MKYQDNIQSLFHDKELSTRTTIAIVAGVSVGLAIGALFATKGGRQLKGKLVEKVSDFLSELTGNTKTKAQQKLGNLIEDVRVHVKQNAEGLVSR